MTTSEKLDKLAREYDRAFHTVTEADYYRIMERLRGAAQSASVAEEQLRYIKFLLNGNGGIPLMPHDDAHSPAYEAALHVQNERNAFKARAEAAEANRHRLIAVINSNLNERDEARAQVTALTAENAVMYSALLAMHRISFDDERTEHQVTAALNAASAALNTPNPAAMRMVEVVNAARAFVEAPDGSHQAAALYEILEDALAALTKGEEG